MANTTLENLNLSHFKWVNKPSTWEVNEENGSLQLTTSLKSDFWQGTFYNFYENTGHIFGATLKEDFTLTCCVEADFNTLYDQAGVMIYFDEKHWLKAGIEYNDGQPMIGSVLTNEVSDWATGVFTGNPRKFYIRITLVKNVIVVKYSSDNISWTLLRLCPSPSVNDCIVGVMACSPQREGLVVEFSDINFIKPAEDVLHSN